MAQKIEYEDKVAIQNDESVAEVNKVTDKNMNEIKRVVNANADEQTLQFEQLQAENAELKETIDKMTVPGEAEGNPIQLKDSSDMECEILVLGNEEQDGEPTTDNPIEIVTVGQEGSVEIEIYNKNILKLVSLPVTVNGVTISENNGKMVLNGTMSGTNDAIKIGEIKAVSGEKYIMSVTEKRVGCGFNMNGNTVGITSAINLNKTTTSTVSSTATSTADGTATLYMAINSGVVFDNFEFGIQVEKSEVASNIISHEIQTATLPIQQPMYEGDEFVIKDNKKYEKHIMKTISTLNNSNLNVSLSSTSTETFFRYYITGGFSDKVPNTKLLKMLCTHFKNVNSRNEEVEGICGWEDAYGICIGTFNTELNTASKMKEYLLNNDVKIVFELANPIYIECTEEQEKILNNFHTYKNVTNITANGITKLKVNYKKDLATVINNIATATVALGGDLNV